MAQVQEHCLQADIQIGDYEIGNVIRTDYTGITYSTRNWRQNSLLEVIEYFPRDFAIRSSDEYSVSARNNSSRESFQYGLECFLDQAKILVEIQHNNIVHVQDVLQLNGTVYQVLNHEEGELLASLLALSEPFSETELKELLLPLLDGLRHMHEMGAVHGDIHPDNIIIRNTGEPVLIATHRDIFRQELRAGYAAAELYDLDSTTGDVSDIYALGATLYRCIAQTDPLSAVERITALGNNETDPLPSLVDSAGQNFSTDLLKIIDWMLSPYAEYRPQSAHEVVQKLENVPDHSNAAAAGGKAPQSKRKGKPFATTLAGKESPETVAIDKQISVVKVKQAKKGFWWQLLDGILVGVLVSIIAVLIVFGYRLLMLDEPMMTLYEDKKDAIDQHLADAEKAIVALNLTTPPESNAFLHYQTVLDMDPGNVEAQEGLKSIVDIYKQLIKKAIKEERFIWAKIYLERAKSIMPGDLGLQKLQKNLSEAKS